jgi:hypothetical protein
MLCSRPVQASSGLAHLIPAIAGRPIYVKRFVAVCDAAGVSSGLQFQDSNGKTLTGPIQLSQGVPYIMETPDDNSNPDGVLTTAAGVGLDAQIGVGNLAGWIQYTQ